MFVASLLRGSQQLSRTIINPLGAAGWIWAQSAIVSSQSMEVSVLRGVSSRNWCRSLSLGEGGNEGRGDPQQQQSQRASPIPPPVSQSDKAYSLANTSLYVNIFNTVVKSGCWLASGLQSASLLAEALHSFVDTCNSLMLWFGVRQSKRSNIDSLHPYGHGRVAYFWGLMSSVSMFSLGSVAVIAYSLYELCDPQGHGGVTGGLAYFALATSLLTDGWVLAKALRDQVRSYPDPSAPMKMKLKNLLDDPIRLGVVLEDSAAIIGVVIAAMGIGLSSLFGLPMFDVAGSVGVGLLMGGIAITLINKNKALLLGMAIDNSTAEGIRNLLLLSPSIEQVYSIKHCWEGLDSFSFKADLDFRGSYFADQLAPIYVPWFQQAKPEEMSILLSHYAEDITRLIEKEVWRLQKLIQSHYPQAMFVELQPHSTISKPIVFNELMALSKSADRRFFAFPPLESFPAETPTPTPTPTPSDDPFSDVIKSKK